MIGRKGLQTREVVCIECRRKVYPYCTEEAIESYICVLCRSGAGKGHREAGRRGGQKSRLRKRQPSPDG